MKLSTKNLTLSGLFLALSFVLPFLTAQLPSMGNAFLPMHLPVLLCGFVCGWPYGLVVGLIAPVLRNLLFGMPPMFPVAVAMAFELAAYGCLSGLFYKLLPKKNFYIYISLIFSMILGRIVWGAVTFALSGISGSPFTWAAFLAGGFTNAIPGMAIQIVLIPVLIIALRSAKLMK